MSQTVLIYSGILLASVFVSVHQGVAHRLGLMPYFLLLIKDIKRQNRAFDFINDWERTADDDSIGPAFEGYHT